MDRLTALKVFRQVVELGSFAEASRRLNLSPAAISKNIGELERHLGVRLLNRTTRNLSKTEAGTLFYDRIARVLEDLDDAESSVGVMQDTPTGLLRVTAPMTLTLIRLSEAIPRFLKRYPKVSLDLQMDSRRVDIIEEGFDVAVRMSDNLQDSSLIAKKLVVMQQVVCGSPSYFKSNGIPEIPEQLRGHNCLKFSLSNHVDEWEFRQRDQKISVAVNGSYKATSSLAVRDALLADLGVSLLPYPYVKADIDAGKLVTVLNDWASATSTVYAVYPSRRHVSEKVRAFLNFLAEELSDN